jgi:tyrosine-protein phosphatase SIW14
MVEDDRFMKFVADNGVDVVHVADDHFPVAEDKVTRVLKIITDLSRYPVLLTSRDGKSFVCLVVGCLRKLQKWSLVSIYDEYRRFSAGSVQQQHEEQFLELFDIDSPLLSKEDN